MQVLQESEHTAHEFCQSVFGLLSDKSVWFSVYARRGVPGEARRFDKDAVAWRAAEVHPVLDSPIVLACGSRTVV